LAWAVSSTVKLSTIAATQITNRFMRDSFAARAALRVTILPVTAP
jgi:hypothetical protein